jgi:ABC-type dipeptide/oligopeptide/nickel transport system permease component
MLIRALPMNPPEGINAAQKESILKIWEARGYNKPLLEQYGIYLKGIITKWDFGTSWKIKSTEPAWDLLSGKLLPTILVNLYSLLFSLPLGLAFGIYAALKKNRWQDHLISTLTMVFISVPSYVYSYLVQYIFCFKLDWFPLQIYAESEAPLLSAKMFYSMIPAIIALGLGVIAGLTRYARAELSEVLTSEFMLLARTKGLTKAQAISRHALRNAMVVILPMIIGEFIGIIGGSLIIEQMFGIPGVGSLYITSINMRDYNFFMMLTAFYTFIGLLSGIVIDTSYGFIDPRIRMGSKK